MAGLKPKGLTNVQYEYLEVLRDAGPSGLETVAGYTFQDKADLRNEVEPYLLRSRMVQIGRGGRILLHAGRAYLEAN